MFIHGFSFVPVCVWFGEIWPSGAAGWLGDYPVWVAADAAALMGFETELLYSGVLSDEEYRLLVSFWSVDEEPER